MADKPPHFSRPPLPSPGRDYEVGYGKPPKNSRFAPGRSGNPGGRRKGSKNKVPALNEERLKTIVLQEAYRNITVTDAGRPVTLSMAEAIVRSMALAAAKGQGRAQRLFTGLLASTERANKALHDTYLEAMITYKTEWDIELERRRQLGIVAPDPVPHPDHIVVDMRTGTVAVRGPMTREDKAIWDKARARASECDEAVAELRVMLREEADERLREVIQRDIDYELRLKAIILGATGT